MSSETRRLLEEALKLPPEARAALAGQLLDSLDHEPDSDAEAAWEREIETRLRELDGTEVRPVPWSEARRAIAEER